ncbi:hypothetical protein LOC68_07665 [Blastopirellula sp. JC732]|uniref:Uncharacterized protein n=1 Tax=Blastopirellula sediminis TaxID=2894196 RepID=A0A9X1MJK9_9BACT|nr:hypothetical protein [Blastopirellula sediminis]MCC9608955.1 hypothetical protein [Blastopirellula sediminis]MCC9628268.1 hypothetical protein [Blastopirellula sediminis]
MVNHASWPALLALLGVFFFAAGAFAEVGDPTLRTDHPVYPGEGAFQTIDDCVAFATRDAKTSQEKAIAMYLWILQHQYHEASPQEWLAGSQTPDAAKPNEALIPYDANAARFSYGYGLCGTVHAWNEPYWRALGFEPRRRAFPGHTNSEIRYDGGWHAFDTDMAGLLFRADGVVAGYDDVARDPGLVKHSRPPVPCYPFAWPADFEAMQNGWRQIAKQGAGKFYRMYSTGYAAQPGIVRLRSGETFTRRFDRDAYGGVEKRRFWHAKASEGGPFRNWTYVNSVQATHAEKLNRADALGNASYCNAEFVYTPDLNGDKWREGVVELSDDLAVGGSPKLCGNQGRPAFVTFEHFSPYVIAGDPVDDANPMAGKATDGLIVQGEAVGVVQVSVSADGGQSWRDVGAVEGAFRLDLTEYVKGRYQWQVRFAMQGSAGLNAISFATTCQMSQSIYPRLASDGSHVVYRNANRGVVALKPNFALSEQELAEVEVAEMRSPNLKYVGRTRAEEKAFVTTNNKPAHVVFRLQSPRKLLEINAAAKFALRVPAPESADFRLEVSTDEGKTWRPMSKADLPPDNEYSSGWMSGAADVAAANVTSALVRVQLYLGGHTTGLFQLEAYGTYETPDAQKVEVIYGWKEGDAAKTFRQEIPAGAESFEFTVPTGKQVVDDFVTIAVE